MNKYILVTLLALTASLNVVAIIADNNTISAKSAYQSGYNHGASDARDPCTNACHWYILKPGKGFAFHTPEFNRGYVDGFCAHSPPGSGSDADEATFSCP
jgi:hypothetical protein